MELDLALDAAGPWSPEDPSSLIETQTWQITLVDWIQTICADPSLPCPALVCQADEVSLGLRFTDDATIADLNSAWRQKTGPTDVLSFAALDDAGDWMEGPSIELGDIIVSLETARRQALEQGHSLDRELRWLVSHGLLHLLGWDHPDDASLAAMLAERPGPVFVKPTCLGSSVGISKARTRQELNEGLDLAAELDQRIVVEKGVKARELECAVIGVKTLEASVVGEIRFDADWYDYTTKYSDGLSHTLIPAPIASHHSDQVRQMALAACRALCVSGMARVDFFYDDHQDRLWINEINTLPGFTSLSMYPMLWDASGLPLETLVARLVENARE